MVDQPRDAVARLAFWADIVTVVSGIMTVVGIGGIVSWSIFQHGATPFSGVVLKVSAFSIKTFICLVILYPYAIVVGFGQVLLAVAFGGEALFWSKDKPIPHILAWAILLPPTIPFFIATCLCVYESSSRPFAQLWNALRTALF